LWEVISGLSQRERKSVLVGGLLAFCLLASSTAHVTVGFGGRSTDALFNTWIYSALMLASSVACLLRAALVHRERGAWALLGVGLLLYTGGEIYYAAVLAGKASVPIPSPADGGYLAFYPLAYAALIALLLARIGAFPVARWLDGVIVATAALSERGEGFAITASQGNVLLPSEAGSVEEAMQLADRRMYANKVSRAMSC
jgi:hypothetical protein